MNQRICTKGQRKLGQSSSHMSATVDTSQHNDSIVAYRVNTYKINFPQQQGRPWGKPSKPLG